MNSYPQHASLLIYASVNSLKRRATSISFLSTMNFHDEMWEETFNQTQSIAACVSFSCLRIHMSINNVLCLFSSQSAFRPTHSHSPTRSLDRLLTHQNQLYTQNVCLVSVYLLSNSQKYCGNNLSRGVNSIACNHCGREIYYPKGLKI